MSDRYAKLIRTLKAVTENPSVPLFTAEVKAITDDTCTVIFGDMELTKVRLKVTADKNTNTMILQPKIGSMVLIGSLTGDLKDLAVLKIDELDKIIMDVKVQVDIKSPKVIVTSDDISVKGGKVAIDADSVTFNGGSNMGLAKVQSIAERLNIIEQDLTTAKAAFTSWIPVPSDGGAALKGIIATWAGATLTQTTPKQLENKEVKH